VNTWDIIQIFLILGIMTGVMYGLLYLVKKYLYSFEKKGDSDSRVKVLSTQAILPKKFVSVIRFNDSVYLLGVSDQSVNLIDKLESSTIENTGPLQNEFEKKSFLQLLKSNMGIK
jgi:flagellar biosynthetic protein FliO